MKKTNAIRILDKKKIKYKIVQYTYDPNNLDVKLIATDNNLPVEIVYKTLVLNGDKNGTFVTLVPGDQELNLKAAAKVSGNKKVKLLPVKEIEGKTGYIRGGCSPLGMKKAFPTFADLAMQDLELCYVNAGVRGILVGVTPSDLEKAVRIVYGNIC